MINSLCSGSVIGPRQQSEQPNIKENYDKNNCGGEQKTTYLLRNSKGHLSFALFFQLFAIYIRVRL